MRFDHRRTLNCDNARPVQEELRQITCNSTLYVAARPVVSSGAHFELERHIGQPRLPFRCCVLNLYSGQVGAAGLVCGWWVA